MAKNKAKAEEADEIDESWPDDREAGEAVGGTTMKDLSTVDRVIGDLDAKQDKISGDRSAAFERFEKRGGNKKAFRDAKKIMNMDMSHARDYIRNREAYLTALGFYNQLDMFEKQDLGVVDSETTVMKARAVEPKEGGPKSVGTAQADAFLSAH